MSVRRSCKECPWKTSGKHSESWPEYLKAMNKIGIDNHACHMITKDTWGYTTKIDNSNICVGQLESNRKKG
jgi:L-rhamnose mutarotase